MVNLPTTISVKPSNPEILKIQPPVSSSVDTKQFQVIISDLIRTLETDSHIWLVKRLTTLHLVNTEQTRRHEQSLQQFPNSVDLTHYPSVTQFMYSFTLPVNELFLFKLHYVKAVNKLQTLTYPSSDLQYCRCKWKSWTNTALLPGQPVHQLDDFPPRGKQDILCIWCSKISHEKSWKKPSKRVWQG